MEQSDTDISDPLESSPAITPKMEDYLRHVYRLEQEADGRVSNSEIAEQLNVSRASVTSMLSTLSEQGLISRERYRPVRLTTKGEKSALTVVRRHRLAETMLAELFDYAISEVDSEADTLEHYLSKRLCGKIEQKLDMPETDPHGDPIPDSNLELPPSEDVTSLVQLEGATSVTVTRILSQDNAVLEHLDSIGLKPGVKVRLDEITPIGMVTIVIEDSMDQTNLPKRLASQVLVSPLEESQS